MRAEGGLIGIAPLPRLDRGRSRALWHREHRGPVYRGVTPLLNSVSRGDSPLLLLTSSHQTFSHHSHVPVATSMTPCLLLVPHSSYPSYPFSWEFGKRIVIQQRCAQCGGSGLVPTSKEGGRWAGRGRWGRGRGVMQCECAVCGGSSEQPSSHQQ